MEFSVPVPPSGQYTYYPGTSEIPEASAANVHGVSYKVLAEVEFTPDSEGVIFAHGSRFGGHALFVKDGELIYVYNFLGIPPEKRIVGSAAGTAVATSSASTSPRNAWASIAKASGRLTLYIDDQMVAEDEIRTILGHFSLCGEGLCIGYDSGDAVSSAYAVPIPVHRRARS